ncbi:MAG: lipopolysaccharide transport periplasmic protein LptA [bacterium]
MVYPQTTQKDEPITITSHQVEIDNKKKVALYSGNVLVSKGELSMTAQKVEIYFGDKEGELTLIKATREVHINWKEYEAHADVCIYNNQTQEITLSGNPEIKQGGNWVKGESITYLLSEERVIVKGSVETIIDKKSTHFSHEQDR